MGPYSDEMKEQVIKDAKETGNIAAVAKRHNVPTTTIHGWIKKTANNGKRDARIELKKALKEVSKYQLENSILKELLKKTNQIWLKD